MEKNYLLSASALLLVGSVAAQSFNTVEGYAVQKEQKINTDPIKNSIYSNTQAQTRAAGDTIWMDGFDNAGDWNEIVPIGQTGLNSTVNGWSIGSTNNSWANFQVMSTNLPYARFVNNDITAGTQVAAGPFIFEYTGVIPDLTGVPAPHLEWNQYGAKFVTTQEIQISTDGGTTWQTAGSNADIPPLTGAGGDPYPNTQIRRFNITNIVNQNPANIQIRLFWDGAQNGPNMNYGEYAWFIDNVRIVEGESDDLTMLSFQHSSNTEGYVYSKMPLNHITSQVFGAEVQNNGANDQTNSLLNVDVIGNAYLESSTAGVTINSPQTDSLVVSNAFTAPATLANYDIKGYVSSDNVLSNNDDDTLTKQLEVTEFIYATDYGAPTGSFFNWANNVGNASIGNVYEIVADDQFWGVDIGLSSATVNDGNDGNILTFDVRKFNTTTQEFDYVDGKSDYIVQVSDFGNIITLTLDNPVQVTAGDLILVTAGNFGENSEVAINMAGKALPGTVLGYNDQSQLISLAEPDFPVVRLNFDPSLSTSNIEEETKNLSIAPNPFNGKATVEYSINNTQEVSFKVTDLTGKVVFEKDLGSQNAGTHNIEIDAANLAEGTYLYSVITDGKATTKRMVVSK